MPPKKKGSKPNKVQQKKARPATPPSDDDIFDDVDRFHEQDEIPVSTATRGDAGEDDYVVRTSNLIVLPFSFIPQEEMRDRMRNTRILTVGGDSEDDEDDEDDDFDAESMNLAAQEIEEEYERKLKALDREQKRTNSSWGRNKSDYYSADTADIDLELESDQEGLLDAEEAEAQRLAAEDEAMQSQYDLGLNTLKSTAKASTTVDTQKQQVASLQAQVRALQTGFGIDGAVSVVSTSAAASPQMTASIREEAQSVITDLQQRLDDLKSSLDLESKLRSFGSSTPHGMSLLEVKNQVLFAYCVNLLFYLTLRLNDGRLPTDESSESLGDVRTHPVVLRLAQLRLVLERVRPLEKKLQYSIDKLVKEANSGTQSAAAVATADEDETSLRPRLDQLADDDEDQDGGDDDSGVYRPPQAIAAAATAPEDKAARKRNRDAKLQKKIAKSGVLSALRSELDVDAPEEDVVDGGLGWKESLCCCHSFRSWFFSLFFGTQAIPLWRGARLRRTTCSVCLRLATIRRPRRSTSDNRFRLSHPSLRSKTFLCLIRSAMMTTTMRLAAAESARVTHSVAARARRRAWTLMMTMTVRQPCKCTMSRHRPVASSARHERMPINGQMFCSMKTETLSRPAQSVTLIRRS